MNLKINLDSILKLPLSKKILILLAINIVFAGVFYWLLTGPKYKEISTLKDQLQNLTRKLNESRVIAADIPKYRREKEELEARLKKAVAQLPNEKEIPDLIDSIHDSSEKAGLKILLFRPGQEVAKGFYADIPVNMSVEGRYESLYNFSVKVSNLPRIVNLSGMKITSMGHKNRVPVLKAVFKATTFRFIPAEQAQGKGKGARKK